MKLEQKEKHINLHVTAENRPIINQLKRLRAALEKPLYSQQDFEEIIDFCNKVKASIPAQEKHEARHLFTVVLALEEFSKSTQKAKLPIHARLCSVVNPLTGNVCSLKEALEEHFTTVLTIITLWQNKLLKKVKRSGGLAVFDQRTLSAINEQLGEKFMQKYGSKVSWVPYLTEESGWCVQMEGKLIPANGRQWFRDQLGEKYKVDFEESTKEPAKYRLVLINVASLNVVREAEENPLNNVKSMPKKPEVAETVTSTAAAAAGFFWTFRCNSCGLAGIYRKTKE